MNTLQLFKTDVWSGIYQHAKKMLAPTLAVTLIYFVLLVILVTVIFSSIIDMDIIREFGTMSKALDPDSIAERSEMIEGLIESIGAGTFLSTIFLFMILAIIVGSWFINLMLTISQDTLTLGKASVGDAFKNSFNKDVWRIAGLYLLIFIMGCFLMILSAGLAKINIGLMFLGMIAAAVILLRFIAAPGAIVHGQMGVSSSLTFSWQNITFKRALKVLLVAIVVAIVLVLISLLFEAIFGFMGGVAGILSVIFQICLSVAYYALFFSCLSAAFFRYADVEIESDEAGHLVAED